MFWDLTGSTEGDLGRATPVSLPACVLSLSNSAVGMSGGGAAETVMGGKRRLAAEGLGR